MSANGGVDREVRFRLLHFHRGWGLGKAQRLGSCDQGEALIDASTNR